MKRPVRVPLGGDDEPLTTREKRLVRAIGIALFSAVLLEKVWLPPIEAPFFVIAALAGWLLAQGYARLSLVRGVAYATIMALMLVLQLFGPFDPAPSYVGLLFFAGIYAPFVIEVPLRRKVYLAIASIFVLVSAFIGVFVMIDWLYQLTGRPMPSLDAVLPDPIRFGGFNYIQPLRYGSGFSKPNGFFMLETSHTSQILAMGLIAELIGRQRLWACGFLLIAQILTFGGTGLILLIICVPLIVLHLRARTVLTALLAAPLVFIGVLQSGIISNYAARSGEFTTTKSSGNARFVEPFQIMAKIVTADAGSALFGIGEGNSKFDLRVAGADGALPAAHAGDLRVSSSRPMLLVLNPLCKLAIEFGLLVAVLWMAWFHLVVVRNGAPLLMSLAVLVQFDLLNGSLLVPINVAFCWLLGGMYAVDRQGRSWRAVTPSHPARPVPMASASNFELR